MFQFFTTSKTTARSLGLCYIIIIFIIIKAIYIAQDR